MPHYKIFISLKKNDQASSGQMISVIREFNEFDLDRIWHMLNMKCESKWGRKLNSFDCVMISKRSQDYRKYVKNLQQKKFNRYEDLLSTDHLPEQTNNRHDANTKSQSVNGKYRNHKE